MARNIVVCIKSVIVRAPAPGSREGTLRSSDNSELNPFDRPAIEMALQIRKWLGARVTVLSMGPEAAGFALREAMAMGADRAVLLCDRALAGSDTLATSTALAAGIGRLSPVDLVLFGTRSLDGDTGQVGPQTAVSLGLPLVSGACLAEKARSGMTVERREDGFLERFEIDFPAALTVSPGDIEPRYAPLAGIETAFERLAVETWNLEALGLSAERVGLAGSPTRVESLQRVSHERKCQWISGTVEEQAEALVERLSERGLL
jgi:electron transfer flavoprotein beta subunit